MNFDKIESEGTAEAPMTDAIVPTEGAPVDWPEYPDHIPDEDRTTQVAQPVPVAMNCPSCEAKHIDEGEWATRPHKTHQCQWCGHEWRPFEYCTVGVSTVNAVTTGTVNRRLLRILMMRHAKSYSEWDNGSLSRVDFGQYGFDRFTNALIKETAPSPKPAVDALTTGAVAEPAVDAFLDEVRTELIRARTKFPGDRIMTIALAEEFGELCKAVLDESAANVRKEAVQTAVMCARVVLDGDGSVTDWRSERGLDPLVEVAHD